VLQILLEVGHRHPYRDAEDEQKGWNHPARVQRDGRYQVDQPEGEDGQGQAALGAVVDEAGLPAGAGAPQIPGDQAVGGRGTGGDEEQRHGQDQYPEAQGEELQAGGRRLQKDPVAEHEPAHGLVEG